MTTGGVEEPLYYTVGSVAERLGIPTATLRSWTRRYGIGPHEHRRGHHRRYTDDDIAVVQRMRALVHEGVSPADAARQALAAHPMPPVDPALLLQAALRLDTPAAARIVEDCVRHYGVIATWDVLCRPAFAAIEALQGTGQGCIDVEHMLSWAVSRALQMVPFPQGEAPAAVVLACGEHEAHSLPLEALRAALCERGVAVVVLGAAVPVSALLDALTHRGRDVTVVLWAQTEDTADRQAVAGVRDAGGRIVVAGPGWNTVDLPDDVTRVDALTDAVNCLVSPER